MMLSTTRLSLGPSNFFCFTLSRWVNLYIPKVSMSGTYDLEDALAGMGITDLFTSQSAFSNITENSPLKPLKVSILGAFSPKFILKKNLNSKQHSPFVNGPADPKLKTPGPSPVNHSSVNSARKQPHRKLMTRESHSPGS